MDFGSLTLKDSAAIATCVAAGAAVLTMIVLIFTARYAARQVEEAKELRRDQSRPYVVPYIDVEQQFLFVFVLENVGATVAFDVSVAFDPPPESEMKDLDAVAILQRPVPTMPPRQRFRTYWESALTVFSDDTYKHPVTYTVTVAYRDISGNRYGPEKYVLDFRVFEGQASGLKAFPELVKAVEELTKEHKKWSAGTNGLDVRTTDAVRKERRDVRPLNIRRTKELLRDEGVLAAARYWIDKWRRRLGLWSR